MTTFIILVLLAANIGQFLNALDLKDRIALVTERAEETLRFRYGVTPENLSEGHENRFHRRPAPFPKLP